MERFNGHFLSGQFITGRTELVKKTGIPATTIERTLRLFEREHQIGQQKTKQIPINHHNKLA